tara:strand:+ start:239 stop:529 length:291 start_codon:yes stop_codon:yes gene_type:complete
LNKNIKKIDIIKSLSIKTGFSLNFSKKLIEDLIYIFIDNIKSGNLNLKNIGTFKIIHKKERLGRNPRTMQEFIIPSRQSISFTASKNILEKTNKFI